MRFFIRFLIDLLREVNIKFIQVNALSTQKMCIKQEVNEHILRTRTGYYTSVTSLCDFKLTDTKKIRFPYLLISNITRGHEQPYTFRHYVN